MIGAVLLVALVSSAAGCTSIDDPGDDPRPSPSPQTTALHVSVPDGSWLDPEYSEGFGDPFEVSGDFCGGSSDGAVIVTSMTTQPQVGTRDVVAWDTSSGQEVWRLVGHYCELGEGGADVMYAHRIGGDQGGTGSDVVDRIDMSTGSIVSSSRLMDSAHMWKGTDSAIVQALSTSQDDLAGLRDTLRFVDASTGSTLWEWQQPDGASGVVCDVYGDASLAVCRVLGPLSWTEMRDLRTGQLRGERIDGDGTVVRLSDGIAHQQAGKPVELRDDSGSGPGRTATSLPSLIAPTGAVLSLDDSASWDRVRAADRSGSPVVLWDETIPGDVSVMSGEALPAPVVGLSRTGDLLLLQSQVEDETRASQLLRTDGEGGPIVAPVDLSTFTAPAIVVIGGTVIVYEVYQPAAHATLVIPAR